MIYVDKWTKAHKVNILHGITHSVTLTSGYRLRLPSKRVPGFIYPPLKPRCRDWHDDSKSATPHACLHDILGVLDKTNTLVDSLSLRAQRCWGLAVRNCRLPCATVEVRPGIPRMDLCNSVFDSIAIDSYLNRVGS